MNIRIDLQLNGTDPGMTCDSPTNIDTSDIKYNCTDNMTSVYGGTIYNGTNLTTTASSTGCTTFNLVESSSSASPPMKSSKNTYWGVSVPLAVYGNCTGTIWFTAILG